MKGGHKKTERIPFEVLAYILIVGFIFWQTPKIGADDLLLPVVGALLEPFYIALFAMAFGGPGSLIIIMPFLAFYCLCLFGAVYFINQRYKAKRWQGITLIIFMVLALLTRDIVARYHIEYEKTYYKLADEPTIDKCMDIFNLPFGGYFCPKIVAKKMFDVPTFNYCNSLQKEDWSACIRRMKINFDKDDISVCHAIEIAGNPNGYDSGYGNCIVAFAERKKDPSLCKQIKPDTGFYDEQSCLVEVAREKHDRSICALIKDTNQHQRCVDATK